MKRYLIILSAALAACGETEDFINNINEAPQINFTANSELPLLTDSIKISLKSSQKKYSISLGVTDKNDNIKSVRYEQLSGVGELRQAGVVIVDDNINIESDQLEFDYFPINTGTHKIRLTVTDEFDQSSSVSIELEAFDNLRPVAAFSVAKIGQRNKLEYAIIANESYDRDAKFGGNVDEYEYRYLDKISPTFKSSIPVIFPESKVYRIGLRVKDNDGVWSALTERDVQIN